MSSPYHHYQLTQCNGIARNGSEDGNAKSKKLAEVPFCLNGDYRDNTSIFISKTTYVKYRLLNSTNTN